ncbi:MAG: hypothetical protein O7E54_07120, partial [Planctomycetota bacterium]|nr:hypothetical protein [Planctomycetota bacterium]
MASISPILRAFLWSFTDLSLTNPGQSEFVALDNYFQILDDPKVGLDPESRKAWAAMFAPSTDPETSTLWRWLTLDWPTGAVPNTLRFTILFMPPYVIAPLLIAWMLDRITRGSVAIRTVIFLPVIISLAVASVI